MKTKRDVLALAKKYGAKIDDQAGSGIYADLPAGKLWKNTSTHCLSSPYDNERGGISKAQAWDDLAGWMADGVEDGCSDSDPKNCDFCNPEAALAEPPTAGEGKR